MQVLLKNRIAGSGQGFNTPIKSKLQHNPLRKPWAFQLLKVGSFKFDPSGQNKVQIPYHIVGFCLSNATPKEQSSSVPVVCSKAFAYSRYAETSIQAILDATLAIHGTL